jgi:hypothetical protein
VPAELLEQAFAVDASFTVRVPREQLTQLRSLLQDLTRGTAQLTELRTNA